MGGVDKGLQPFNGQPLVEHVLRRLASQQGGALAGVILSANRHADDYRHAGEVQFGAQGVKVVSDRDASFSGPLAGFQAGLDVCPSRLMLSVPCDSPFLPLDLAIRLLRAMVENEVDLAMVMAPHRGLDGPPVLRSQPVFSLMRSTVAPSLHAFLATGGRKVEAWAASLQRVQVPFNAPGDDPRAFANANTLLELRQLES